VLTSWKTWTVLLVLGLVGIGVTLTLPIVNRLRALAYFDQHKPAAGYEFSPEREDWPEKYGEWTNALRNVLRLHDNAATDETLSHLAAFSEVTSIGLKGSNSRRFQGTEFSASLPRLETLFLIGQCFTDDLIADMLECRPPLTTLRLWDTGAGERTLQAASRLPTLELIDLGTRYQQDVVFRDLMPMPHLQSLNAIGAGDHCAEWLAECPNVTHVYMSDSSLTDAGLRRLTESRKLTNLYLNGTLVTNSGLQHLANLVRLESLQLNECPELLPEGVVGLPQLPHLLELRISADILTRESVEYLRRLPYAGGVVVNGEFADPEIRDLADEAWELQDDPPISDDEAWEMLHGQPVG
jgi:hypothetical protein